MKNIFLFFILFLFASNISFGQTRSLQTKKNKEDYPQNHSNTIQNTTNAIKAIKIKWKNIRKVQYADQVSESYLYFEGANYTKGNGLPIYTYKKLIGNTTQNYSAKLVNSVFEPLEIISPELTIKLESLQEVLKLENEITFIKKKAYFTASFIPIIKDPISGKYYKLVSADLELSPVYGSINPNIANANNYASNSVLKTGDWYKLSISSDGIHILSYAFLKSIGIDVDNINPQNLRLFGNGGGMLPFSNSDFRYDDLEENSIQVIGENDGSFDATDYILFYGKGPNTWNYNVSENRFKHQKHLYSNKACYFLTTNGGTGSPKRISLQNSYANFNTTVTEFDDFSFHEEDLYNLLISGREWYGERFDAIKASHAFSFSFPNISSDISIKASVLGRSIAPTTSSFSIYANGQLLPMNLNTGSVQGNYLNPYGNAKTDVASFSSGGTVSISMSYGIPNSSANGWLNYLELNTRRLLAMHGTQMQFRDTLSLGIGNIAKYTLSNTNSASIVWDITNVCHPKQQETTLINNSLEFSLPSDSLKEFIAYQPSNFLLASFDGIVSNQDIHGTIGQPDLVIITNPLFLSQATSLAAFRETNDNLDVSVYTTTQVYNEFSSGTQDITAIKDLMRMLYNRAVDSTEMPRYLLLFGDGSYDNLNRISDNTNFVPTYQSLNSHAPQSSYVSDDYFGLLDDTEGEGASDQLDIGIGRIPVKSSEEATQIINKIFYYESSNSMGSWRNNICFIADDEDNNIHISAADNFATHIDTAHPSYDIDKIYLDAYPQQSTPAGQRYPDVTQALNRRIEKGALIINYTGHGGELGWAHEQILQNADIKAWDNIKNLPLFMTATCEFSRFDDPERSAAGEYVFLNPGGGGIALLTTVRLVTSGANETLTRNFYNSVFLPKNNQMPRLGDVVMATKNASNNGINSRKYLLIGDPSMQLAYPMHIAKTDSIDGVAVAGISDTLKALSKVTISGHVEDEDGQKLTSFNGTLFPTVYDKASDITTLKNDAGSNYKTFSLQKNALFRGKASVENGNFSYSFIVPKDISYENGLGRISYYAENGLEDANGYYEDFIIGGTSDNITDDDDGPKIDLFLNDSSFVFGGTTNESPTLLAYIYDEHGINTTGNGIGHDIVALLDEKAETPIVLNDEYEADKDSYQKGTVSYPLSSLSEGKHQLSLKAWDVYNNSSKTFTEFIVAQSASLALSHVLNYPNPFTTYTEFWFEHNRPNENLQVQIQIFTISGKLIKTINTNVFTAGFRPDPKQTPDLQWNGTDDYGDRIGRGVYVYKLRVTTEDGLSKDRFEKLVILN